MLARVGGGYLGSTIAALATGGAIEKRSARDVMLVLTTGRKAGGEARRGGDGARPHGSAEYGGDGAKPQRSYGVVPGEVPDTAVCYGHCWYNGNTCLVKQ